MEGRGLKSGGLFAMKRAKQPLVLMAAMLASMVLVMGWDTSPLSIFYAVQEQTFANTRPVVTGSAAESSAQMRNTVDASKLYEAKVAFEKPKRTPTLDPLYVKRAEDVLAPRETETTAEATTGADDETTDGEETQEESDGAGEGSTRLQSYTALTKSNSTLIGKNFTMKSSSMSVESTQTESEIIIDMITQTSNESKPAAIIETGHGRATHKNSAPGSDTEITHKQIKMQQCNYSVGKWVHDHHHPLYSGKECKMWLSPSWSCHLNKRPDMSYEHFRWQPSGCDLPKFDGHAFLNRLRNMVLGFIGDSLARQQIQSLMCMITQGKNNTVIDDVGPKFGFHIPRGERKPTGVAYRFQETNTTILMFWSTTLAEIEILNTTDPLSRRALHLDRPLDFLRDHLNQMDIVILNSGHHWNRGKLNLNRLDFHFNGLQVGPRDPLNLVSTAYNQTIHSVLKWVSKQIENTSKVVFYRTLSPRHFRNGDWNTGGTCDSIRFDKEVAVQEGALIDSVAESASLGTNVNLLNITALSLLRGEAHISKYGGGRGGQDCLHWCLPGIPDTWNEILFAQLSLPILRTRELTSIL